MGSVKFDTTHLAEGVTGASITLSKTAVNNAFEIDVDDTTTYPEGSEFYVLRNSKNNIEMRHMLMKVQSEYQTKIDSYLQLMSFASENINSKLQSVNVRNPEFNNQMKEAFSLTEKSTIVIINMLGLL